MPLHGIAVLVGNPTRAAGSEERAPKRRDAWDQLYNGIPWDMGSGGDNWWVWGVHHHQMTTTKSTCEVGDEEGQNTHSELYI